jgi:hypothetical protein
VFTMVLPLVRRWWWCCCLFLPLAVVVPPIVVPPVAVVLAGNVADMSRHVADDTQCCSNFGQMGPCRRHYFFNVVAVCVGSSRHFLDFSEFVCRNILWYRSTYAQILSTSFLSCSPFCHVLQFVMFWRVTTHTHTSPTRENTKKNSIIHSIRDRCLIVVSFLFHRRHRRRRHHPLVIVVDVHCPSMLSSIIRAATVILLPLPRCTV